MVCLRMSYIWRRACLGDYVAIKYPDRVYSEEEVNRMWNKNWGDTDEPYINRADRGYVNRYSHDPLYLIALSDEEKGDVDVIVGYAGWKDNDSFLVTAGVRVLERYRDRRISVELNRKRLEKIGNKPILAGLNNRNLPAGVWRQHWERSGWIGNPTDEQLASIPQDVMDYHKKKYGDAFLLYLPSAMAKAWNVVKADSFLFYLMED